MKEHISEQVQSAVTPFGAILDGLGRKMDDIIKTRYSKETVDAMHKESDGKLDKILAEVQDTNGKVAAIIKWKERVIGATKMAGYFVVLVLLPILSWALYQVVTIDDRIQGVFNNYEVEVVNE